jgi:membrane protease YdiL (CAAX protease family)
MINSIPHSAGAGISQSATASYRAKAAPFLPMKCVSLRMIIGSLLLAVSLACPAFLVMALFPITAGDHSRSVEVLTVSLTGLLLHVFVGPLIEEIVYRGLFLQIGRRYLSTSTAVGLSSLAFALTHFIRGPATVLIAFVMSLLISWVFIRSGSLIPGYVLHATFNYAAVFVVGPLLNFFDQQLATAPGSRISLGELMPGWGIGISIAAAAGSIVLLRQEFKRAKTSLDGGAKLAANIV